jgi:outer membrane protein
MQLFKLSFVMVSLWLVTATAINAQSFGYVNSQEILVAMPEMQQAENTLEVLQKQLQKRGQDMFDAFQTKLAFLQKKAENGELTPIDQEEQSKVLETEQLEITIFEKKMIADLQEKRGELLQPIYNKINDAIALVAKEQGLKMIFDQQVLLYGEESLDVSALVKAKLGI